MQKLNTNGFPCEEPIRKRVARAEAAKYSHRKRMAPGDLSSLDAVSNALDLQDSSMTRVETQFKTKVVNFPYFYGFLNPL